MADPDMWAAGRGSVCVCEGNSAGHVATFTPSMATNAEGNIEYRHIHAHSVL